MSGPESSPGGLSCALLLLPACRDDGGLVAAQQLAGPASTVSKMSVGLRRWGSRAARVTARLGIAAGGIAGVAALASAADYAAKCGDTRLDWVSTGVRLGRSCCLAVVVTVDYKLTLSRRDAAAATETAAQQQARLDAAHSRNAERLKGLLFANRGIYIKLGQHMGLLDYLLPPEYVNAMRGCFDEAPASPWSAVRGTFRQELGKSPDEVFASFEREPIASASLAQVHVATLKGSGETVAVKVQHPGLQSMARAEIGLLEGLLRVVYWALPQADLQWLVDEVKFNLPRELDFQHEAQNAKRARTLLQRFGDRVVVPRVLSELSTSRILVMDYEPGCQIADKATIEGEYGLNPREVARLMSEIFCEMVFVHGFVHCDPHPGNLLVRCCPSDQNRPQIVVLDHGLYRWAEK
jgi:aarF domain-containing kinase